MPPAGRPAVRYISPIPTCSSLPRRRCSGRSARRYDSETVLVEKREMRGVVSSLSAAARMAADRSLESMMEKLSSTLAPASTGPACQAARHNGMNAHLLISCHRSDGRARRHPAPGVIRDRESPGGATEPLQEQLRG